MKKMLFLTLSIMLFLGLSMIQAEDKAWFDMENCGMCKHIGAEEHLMENMTWEQYHIKNGIISISRVNPEFMEAYERSSMNMMKTGEKLMTGEQIEMCGSCVHLGSLFAKGLQSEQVKMKDGGIMLFTSDNTEVIAALHEWADKNSAEMKKMDAN